MEEKKKLLRSELCIEFLNDEEVSELNNGKYPFNINLKWETFHRSDNKQFIIEIIDNAIEALALIKENNYEIFEES